MKIEFVKKVNIEIVEESGKTYTQEFERSDIENVEIIESYGKFVDVEFSDGGVVFALDKEFFKMLY